MGGDGWGVGYLRQLAQAPADTVLEILRYGRVLAISDDFLAQPCAAVRFACLPFDVFGDFGVFAVSLLRGDKFQDKGFPTMEAVLRCSAVDLRMWFCSVLVSKEAEQN